MMSIAETPSSAATQRVAVEGNVVQERQPVRLAVVQIDGIPRAVTPSGRYWVPSEPLADSLTQNTDPLETLSCASLFAALGTNAAQVLRRIESYSVQAMTDKLSEILAFLNQQAADIIVLPEYLAPPEAVSLLKGYANGRMIIAGFGLVRNVQEAQNLVAQLTTEDAPADLVNQNVAIVMYGQEATLVSKRHLAEHEVARSGTGPQVFTVNFGPRRVRVAVAICIDYLRCADEILEFDPDFVCIPALTSNTDAFKPDAPRDYVRAIANHSSGGGSTIYASSLRGPCFTDPLGARPLPKDVEGIILVDYDEYPRRPTGLRRTENSLRARAEIISRSTRSEAALTALRSLSDLRHAAGEPPDDIHSRIARWLEHLKDRGPLVESLEELRRALAQETHDAELMQLLTMHTTVAPGGSSDEIRVMQASFLVERLGELVASGNGIPNVGRMIDAYASLRRSLEGAAQQPEKDADQRWRFSLRLGAYDGETAAATLPRQLSFLRSISSIAHGALDVTYRMHTVTSVRSPDLVTLFDVIVTGDPTVMVQEQVESQMRSMYVASWPIETCDQLVVPRDATHFATMTTKDMSEMPVVREDWASLADLLRTHDVPIAVDMRVRRSSDVAADDAAVPKSSDEQTLGWLNSFPAVVAGEAAERRAAAFYSVISEANRPEHRVLEFTLIVSSPSAIPDLLLATIQREVFGPLTIETHRSVSYPANAVTCVLTAGEAIRLFHPPYGRMQARGTAQPTKSEVPFRGDRLPEVGTLLGTARITGPRNDHRRDVRLDDSARTRHVYVVGKTGTGKTNLLKELCRQDIEDGRGLAVIDPHGDLVDYLAGHCGPRLDETVLLDFGDKSYVPILNPLMLDISTRREQILHVSDFNNVLATRYYNEFTGPVFDDMVSQAIETMFAASFTLTPSLGLIESMYRNRDLRLLVGRSVEQGSTLRDRWSVFEQLPEKQKAERITWMLAKFADLLPENGTLRLATCSTRKSPLSLNKLVCQNGILLIKLPEAALGSSAASFLGSLVVRRLERAVFDYETATGLPVSERDPYTIYLDEFQKFATAGLETLLSEARKFGCGLVMAHQNLEQLFAFSKYEGSRSRELLEAIIGNAGTVVSFRIGAGDIPAVAKLLRCKEDTLSELQKYKALCRLTVDNDDTPCFTIRVADSARRQGLPASLEGLRERMISEGYWAPTADAIDEVATQTTEFERTLASRFQTEVRKSQVALAENLKSKLADDPSVIEEILEERDPSGELIEQFYLDLLSAAVRVHVGSQTGEIERLARTLFKIMLDAVDDEAEDISVPSQPTMDATLRNDPAFAALPEISRAKLSQSLRMLVHFMLTAAKNPSAVIGNPANLAGLLVDMLVMGQLPRGVAVTAVVRSQALQEATAAAVPAGVAPETVRGFEEAHTLYWELTSRGVALVPPV